jgi:hypothetical protein
MVKKKTAAYTISFDITCDGLYSGMPGMSYCEDFPVFVIFFVGLMGPGGFV